MNLTVGSLLRGLVDAGGSGGGSVGGTDWSVIFHLAAWRVGTSVSRAELRCEMAISEPALREFMRVITPYCLVEARILGLGPRGAALLEDLEVFRGDDPELIQIRNELLIPVRINTPNFGVLEFDRRFQEYSGEVEWCGAKVRLHLRCADDSDPSTALAAATSLFETQTEWSGRVSAFAADRLLPLKNDSWLQDDEAELSRADFISRMTLNEISVDASGALTFWHDDGDLFWGHAIQISGDLAQGLSDADIHG